MKTRIFIISCLFLLVLKTIDWLLLDKLFFKIPNQMEWDTSPWYNFLDHRKKIGFQPEENGVIVIGSSIALYSVLPSELNSEKAPYRVEMYSHVAMAPTDAYYYLPNIISKKPKTVVYVFNPADFQLEFLEQISDTELEFQYEKWLRHFAWRHPARLIYPNEFVWDYFSDLSKTEIYKLLGKGFLYINRYREFFWDPIDSYIERNFRSGRSYHIYTGSMPKEGIWSHGWTKQSFTLACEEKNGKWEDSIYIPQDNSTLTIQYGDTEPNKVFYEKKGWKSIEFIFPENYSSKKFNITLSIDKSYSSRLADNKPYGREYPVGIRLSQNFCSTQRKVDYSYNRPNFLDEERFHELSIPEYREDYYERMYKDSDQRPELSRMKVLAEKKELIKDMEFIPWIEVERFAAIKESLDREGIEFILILSPENPIEIEKYRNYNWYYGMLEYFGNLSKGHFFDASILLPDERKFSDPHHLTLEGSIEFSQYLKQILIKEFQKEKIDE